MDKWGIEFIQSHILKIWRLTYPHEFNGKIIHGKRVGILQCRDDLLIVSVLANKLRRVIG